MGKRKFERVRRIQNDEKEAEDSEEEEERRGVAGLINNLTIETAGKEEEAAENLKAGLGMEAEEICEVD